MAKEFNYFGGVGFFWIIAIVILTSVAFFWGIPTSVPDNWEGTQNTEVMITQTIDNFPAQLAGIEMGDKIVNFDKNKPKIISPSPGCEYFIPAIANNKQKLTSIATGSFDTDKLYWFINGKFYDQCNTGERMFWAMEEGKHKITCADKYGRSSSVTISVR